MPRATAAASTPRTPLCPPLPPEIWISIFQHHTSPTHLWTTCRHVSPLLRACAERAFALSHLSCVTLDFLLDRHNLGGKRGPGEPAIALVFSHVGRKPSGSAGEKERGEKGKNDGNGDGYSTAWFTGHFRGHKVSDARTSDAIMQRWRENVAGRRPELPGYTISVGDAVNDTHIPGLEIEDVEARDGEGEGEGEEYRVRLDWRSMLDLFFREQVRLEYDNDDDERVARTDDDEEEEGGRQQQHPATTTTSSRTGTVSKPTPPHTTHDPLLLLTRRIFLRRARLTTHYAFNPEMLWAISCLQYFERPVPDSRNRGNAAAAATSPQMLPHLPGAGLGERWFGSTNVVQELYLDEWSSVNRIEMRVKSLEREREREKGR